MQAMTDESEDLADPVEDTAYFDEARKWYSTVYLSVISERYFFIILTTIAILTGVIALTAIIRLMPINPRAPFLYLADNAYEQVPIIKPIKTYRTQDINDALRRFFIAEYVMQREGYSSSTVSPRLNFVRSHSSKEAFARYAAYMDVRNKNSPVQQLGIYYVKNVSPSSASLEVMPIEGRPNYFRASMPFTVNLAGPGTSRQTIYRADIEFFYKDLIVEQTKDMEEHKPFHITPMRFLITDYKVKIIR